MKPHHRFRRLRLRLSAIRPTTAMLLLILAHLQDEHERVYRAANLARIAVVCVRRTEE